MSNSFPKEARLRVAEDFSFLREGARRFSFGPFVVFFKPSRLQFPHSRIGLAISKKVGKANVRNLVKRVVRENFRNNSNLRSLGYDFTIVFRGPFKIEDETIPKLHRDFTELSRRLVERSKRGEFF